MAIERGWWNITYTTEPEETDLQHIAKMIIEGYTSGEIVGNNNLTIKDLPHKLYNYLSLWDYKDKNSKTYKDLTEELKNHGYIIADDDNSVGEYNELRAYNNLHIEPITEEE